MKSVAGTFPVAALGGARLQGAMVIRRRAENYLVVLDAERVRNDAIAQVAASDLGLVQIQVQLLRAPGGAGR
ncbi:MAG TPA: hypothetical protein VJ798_11510 [Rhizomicrobium sp.]|nr:hypothetical protein [Rhizomicrobium sp.]